MGLDPGTEPGRDYHRLEQGQDQGPAQPQPTCAGRVNPRGGGGIGGSASSPGRALIPHHGGVDDPEAFARLARTVYVTARAGAVDCTAAFDLAASKLEVSPLDQDAGELARLSLDCAEASQSRMAEVALSLLAAVGFEPGFREEPSWLACLQDAMRLVNLDVAATGIRRPCQLRVHDDEPGNAYVETGDGYTGTAQGIFPASGADRVSALVAVADDAQDALMHAIWAAWPVCPVHRLGVHPREHDGAAVWWCARDGGHAVAAIGRWPGMGS